MRDPLDKRLLFVTGKGGVGKSTVALALGKAAAKQGKRTIICEISAQEHASRVLRRNEVGYHEVEIADDLFAISIDPDEAMREYVLLQVKVKAMRDLLFRTKIFTYLAAATPGLRELVTIGKIWELALDERKVKKGRRYDLVIVDAPATGHGIGFLETPRTFARIAKVGPMHAQAEALDTFICNHRRTGVVLVALPEEMPVNESALLEQRLAEDIGVSVDRAYMNALYPERYGDDEAAALERAIANGDGAALGRGATAAVRAALGQHHRAASQREQLARLRELLTTPVSTLPFVFRSELGMDEISTLAEIV